MTTARDIMTTGIISVLPDTPVDQVADLLAAHRFGAVPVMDADRNVLGIVTEDDLLQRVADVHLPRHITFLGSIIYLENPHHFEEEAQKILGLTAIDIMETQFPTITTDMTLSIIAAKMLAEDLRRMIVIDDDGKLLGIITRADIVRLMAHTGDGAK